MGWIEAQLAGISECEGRFRARAVQVRAAAPPRRARPVRRAILARSMASERGGAPRRRRRSGTSRFAYSPAAGSRDLQREALEFY